MPDPRLKAPIEEIQAILTKYDLCGLVFLSSETHIEFLYKFDASWTCIRHEEDGAIRFLSKRSDYPSKEEQKRVGAISAGTVIGLADAARSAGASLDTLTAALAQKWEISHTTRDDRRGPPT